jgi:hypothetical protein
MAGAADADRRRSDAADGSESDGANRRGAGTRRRLRSIADDDRRERYGLSPNWLEVGGLAQSATDGLVVVWSLGRSTAEVQPLNGGENHWVSIKDLSPPRPGWGNDRS